MLRRLRRFLALPAAERRRLWRAAGALGQASVGLRLLGYTRCLAWLDRRSGRRGRPDRGGPEALELAASYARAVGIAAGNVPFRTRCLERSVALWWLLRSRRIPAEIRIGVRKSPADLEAHAWVELAGRAVNDGEDVHRHYAAFDGPAVPRPAAPESAVRRPTT